MPGFNPDEFLKQPVRGGFDPDQFLAQSFEDDPSLNYYREKRPMGREGMESQFKSEDEYLSHLDSLGQSGNTKFLDPRILGEMLRGKITGNYSHYEDSDQAKAFKHGAVQGATFNLGDELEGRAKQFLDNREYESARDESRVENQRLQDVSPNTYMAGEIAGSLAVPGMGAGKLGTRIASNVAQGGLDAYGRNENPDDLLTDIGTGMAIGGAVPVAFEGLGKGVSKVRELMPKAEQIKKAGYEVVNNSKNRALGLLFDIPEDSVDDILKNPDKVRNALSLQEIGERIPESISILNKEIKNLDGKAWQLLDDSKQFGHSNKSLEGIVDNLQGTLMTETKNGMIPIGLAEEKAFLKLDKIKEKINQYDDILSERQVKKIIQSLDSEIDWERIDNSLPDQMMRDLRFRLDDVLKQNNTAYSEAMKPVSQLTDLSHYIKNQFGIKKGQGGVDGLVASDLTLSKLNNTLNDRKAFTQDKLKEFGRLTGQDILDETKYSKLASSMDSATTQGSRKTNMGALALGGVGTAVGSMFGSPAIGGAIGGAVGGAVGYSLDKYGRKMGKSLLLESGNPMPFVNRFKGTKYFAPLQEAVKKGNKSLAVTHYLLSKTDPEFRKMNEDKE